MLGSRLIVLTDILEFLRPSKGPTFLKTRLNSRYALNIGSVRPGQWSIFAKWIEKAEHPFVAVLETWKIHMASPLLSRNDSLVLRSTPYLLNREMK